MSGENAFEEFLKSKEINDTQKEGLFSQLIKWIVFNYSNNKTKGAPAGQRIFTLSSNIEQLLGKLSVSQEAVSICLPILMKTILLADSKLRDLTNGDKGSVNK